MAKNVTTSLKNWDFAANHVQQGLTGGDFVGSHSVVLCATAPRAADLAASSLPTGSSTSDESYAIPIGVINSASMQQSKQIAQIFEIGSHRSYIMSARSTTSLAINRILYNGPNLLRSLYAYYPVLANDLDESNIFRDSMDSASNGIGINEALKDKLSNYKIKSNPGYNNFWLNIASEIFNQPTGLILFIKDNDQRDVASVYLEECHIQNHAFNMSADSVIMAEQVNIICDRVLPVKVHVTY